MSLSSTMRARASIVSLGIFAAFIAADLFCWYQIFGAITFGYAAHVSRIFFLDVGQGDAELLLLSNGRSILTDTGPSGPAILRALDPVFAARPRSLDLVILSAPEADSYGGLRELLDQYHVGAVAYNGRDAPASVSAWPRLLEAIAEKQIPLITLGAGDRIHFGADGDITILSPDHMTAESPTLPDTGLVQFVRTPEFSAVLAADISSDIEDMLVARYGTALRADILKIAHHGSKNSSDGRFLAAVHPQAAIIEVGKGNSYHQPSPEALARIASSTAAKLFRTDEDGTIMISRTPDGALTAVTAR